MRYCMAFARVALVFIIGIGSCLGQRASSKKMTNQDVVDMISIGLSDDVIVDKIHSAEETDFDTSLDSLKALKKANASDTVIRAMINPHSAAPAAAMPTPLAGDPNDPNTAHDAGIYLYANTRNGRQMQLLEPTVYSQGKSGGTFKSAMTYGIAKVKWKAVVRGEHANLRTSDTGAVFYFYFEEKSAGLSHNSFGTVTTPNEFTLLRLEVKRDTRETTVMKANAFGASSGTDDKYTIPFSQTRLSAGVYKVVPNAPLRPGEYCFLSAAGMGAYAPGSAAASREFDFGIAPPE